MFTVVGENEPMKTPKDRRTRHRYALRLPLRYRLADGAWRRGRTLDMSAGGILIDIAEAIPEGAELEVEMEWTGLYHGGQVSLFLTASVARVDERGTALRILQHEFRGPSVRQALALAG